MPVFAIRLYAYYCPECGNVQTRDIFAEASQAGINHLKSHRNNTTEEEEQCEDTSPSDTAKLQAARLIQELSVVESESTT